MMFMMLLMMGFVIVFVFAVAFLLPILIGRNADGKAKRTELEKPKRHPFALGDDGELVEINEDEAPLLYAGEARQ